jgi:hypothetical protein
MSTISGTVSTTVTLDSGSYSNVLTITSAGSVVPSSNGATAIYSDVASGLLVNDGLVRGTARDAQTAAAGAL